MNPGIGPLFYSNPWVLRMQCKECKIDNSYLHFTQFNKCTHKVSQFLKIGLTHKKSPVESPTVATCPFAGERRRGSRVRFPKEERCAESPPTFICGKRRKNRRKPVKMKILSSGVVFTFEEGISTSHVCLKGQQPIF